ncbi:hypothetical protein E4U42_002669 [Claviceps africana]|uniref:Uncharacterized protein n=1 Tax=Claviceps africana TaxID=83212 RepID=A0A8K0NIF7_9HYPO|nr:hypothetical protein E4U42_002669 [Claviceps africana]
MERSPVYLSVSSVCLRGRLESRNQESDELQDLTMTRVDRRRGRMKQSPVYLSVSSLCVVDSDSKQATGSAVGIMQLTSGHTGSERQNEEMLGDKPLTGGVLLSILEEGRAFECYLVPHVERAVVMSCTCTKEVTILRWNSCKKTPKHTEKSVKDVKCEYHRHAGYKSVTVGSKTIWDPDQRCPKCYIESM